MNQELSSGGRELSAYADDIKTASILLLWRKPSSASLRSSLT